MPAILENFVGVSPSAFKIKLNLVVKLFKIRMILLKFCMNLEMSAMGY